MDTFITLIVLHIVVVIVLVMIKFADEVFGIKKLLTVIKLSVVTVNIIVSISLVASIAVKVNQGEVCTLPGGKLNLLDAISGLLILKRNMDIKQTNNIRYEMIATRITV